MHLDSATLNHPFDTRRHISGAEMDPRGRECSRPALWLCGVASSNPRISSVSSSFIEHSHVCILGRDPGVAHVGAVVLPLDTFLGAPDLGTPLAANLKATEVGTGSSHKFEETLSLACVVDRLKYALTGLICR